MGRRRVWVYWLWFAGLAFLDIFASLLPLGRGGGLVPGPDLTFLLVLAWVQRRPDYIPVWLLVPVLLLGDALLVRPLGLWTLIVMLVAEFLRRRVDPAEALPFAGELGRVALLIVGAFAANHLILVLLFADPAPVLGVTLHALMTLVLYPFVLIITRSVFGVRRLQPGELDSLGHRA